MNSTSRASLALGLFIAAPSVAFAGDHFWWRSTTATTTAPVAFMPAATPLVYSVAAPVQAATLTQAPTLGAASVPMAFNFVQPVAASPAVAAPAAAPVAYYYYASVPHAATAPMTAPSLLNEPPPAAAVPLNPAAAATPPAGARAGAAGGLKDRLIKGLRDFAANNNLDRDTLKTTLRQVGLGLLRAEMNQVGLGFLVPSPKDQNVLDDLVDQVVKQRFGGGGAGDGGEVAGDGGAAAGNGNGAAAPSFVFQGPVTLSFPNVQAVQIQAKAVQQVGGAGAAAAEGDPRTSDAPEPTPNLAPIPPQAPTP